MVNNKSLIFDDIIYGGDFLTTDLCKFSQI
jgi:hypothetical protein